MSKRVVQRAKEDGEEVIFECGRNPHSMSRLLRRVIPEASKDTAPLTMRNVMIAGVPNVGKGTVLNALQQRATASGVTMGAAYPRAGVGDALKHHTASEAPGPPEPLSSAVPFASMLQSKSKGRARTGPRPGVTRLVASHWLCRHPRIALIDSPGIMMPRFDDKVETLKLVSVGVCGGAGGVVECSRHA